MKNIDAGVLDSLKAGGKLPSPKGVALRVLTLCQQEDAGIPQIARLIQTDPALASTIIKFANAVFGAPHRPIASINDAVMVLGLPAVRRSVLGLSLLSENQRGPCQSFDYQGFWSSSLAAAIAAQHLGGCARTSPDETFILGLLAQIGKLALATAFPGEYGAMLSQESAGNIIEQERARFSTDHQELAAALMLDWGMPQLFAQAALCHEAPESCEMDAGSRDYQLALVLHLATHIARLCTAPPEKRSQALDALYLPAARLGLDSGRLGEIYDITHAQWQEWCQMLHVPAQHAPSFSHLAGDASQHPAEKKIDSEMPLRILAVDDDPITLKLLATLLGKLGHNVQTAINGADALGKIVDFDPQLVITDWMMPELDGVALCRALRATRFGQHVYFIILTALEDEEHLVEAFEAGVDDYIVKPLNSRVLGARLRAGQRILRLQREVALEWEKTRRFSEELIATNRRLQEAALTDPLTGLHNRRHAMERLEQVWSTARRTDRPAACLMVDLDRFKTINDRYGHATGDAALCHAAAILQQTVRAGDVVCRMGGEEFLVICPDTGLQSAANLAERIRTTLEASPFELANEKYILTTSIGVAQMEKSTASQEQLLHEADQALYFAKAGGRNRVALAEDNQNMFWDSPV